MALTATQQTKILQLLGYPAKSLDATSVLYDKILSDRLTSLSAETESLVLSYLSSVAAIETQMAAAPARFISEKVGDITLNPHEITKLRSERRVLSRELAQLLDITIVGGSGGLMTSVVC